jgi:plasmid stability protein
VGPRGAVDCNAFVDYAESGADHGAENLATLTIRKLEEGVKARLRVQAAQHGRSMEEEARHILRQALASPPAVTNLADLAEALFGGQGVELDKHPAVPAPEPPDFGS